MTTVDLNEIHSLRITCAPDIPPWLTGELLRLGAPIVSTGPTWVDTEGSIADALRLNLQLRTAFAVLLCLADFDCDSPEDLYDGTFAVPWETIIPPDGYLSVASRAHHPSLSNWTYANLKVKDAIVDRVSEHAGRRPDSGPDRSGMVVNVFWEGPHCQIYLNVSGNKLSDRGYRRIPHKAPMIETLAAAVLAAAGYTGEQPLVNPMCGSGTIAIEAALMASGRAPGLLRADYGLKHTLWEVEEAWQAIRRELRAGNRRAPIAPIIATDHDPVAIDAAKKNAQTAGVDGLIDFAVCDFAETKIPEAPGIVLLNPEYGERLGRLDELTATYERIGDFFKQRCPGWTGYVFTGNMELGKRVGLHASRRIVFHNAKIECRLLKYEIYSGTRRKAEDSSPS